MKCLICNEEFSNRQKFAYHLNTTHNINTKEYKIKYKPDKDNNLLECPICGKYNMKQLTQHLTDIHKITKDEFLEQYPNTKLWVDEISERCSRAQSVGIETFKNNLKTDPHYYDDMYKKRAENRNWDGFAEKVRKTREERGTNEKMSKLSKRNWQDADYRKLQSDKAKKQHENGLTQIIMERSGKKRYKVTLNNVTYSMRSTWEIQFATYLNESNIEFKYEPFSITYEYNNSKKLYYPDFYIPKYNLVIEVKPFSLINNGQVIAKQEACLALNYKFMFITENELKQLDKIQFE